MTAFGDYIQIMITERCNMRCVHCAVPEEDSPAEFELTTDEWKEFITVTGAAGSRALTISGGEASLREDAADLLAHAAESGYERVTLLSNGLIRTSMLRSIADVQQRYPEVIGFHVSLDGASSITHDRIRGLGTFRAIRGRLDVFREFGGRITGVHTVIHQGNLGEFDDLVAMVGELGANVWTVFPVAALGRANTAGLVSLAPEQWADVTERLSALRRDPGLDVGQMGPVGEDDWPSSLGVVTHGREPVSNNVVVGPDGGMFLCPPLRDKLIGSARTIDGNSWTESRRYGSSLTEGICGSCKFHLLCTGIDPAEPFRVATDDTETKAPEVLLRELTAHGGVNACVD